MVVPPAGQTFTRQRHAPEQPPVNETGHSCTGHVDSEFTITHHNRVTLVVELHVGVAHESSIARASNSRFQLNANPAHMGNKWPLHGSCVLRFSQYSVCSAFVSRRSGYSFRLCSLIHGFHERSSAFLPKTEYALPARFFSMLFSRNPHRESRPNI